MANEFHCDNCGKTGYGTATFNGANPPRGWKTKREGLLKVKNFCSSKCKDEYYNRNNSIDSDSPTDTDFDSNSNQNGGGFIPSVITAINNKRPKTDSEIAAEERERKEVDEADARFADGFKKLFLFKKNKKAKELHLKLEEIESDIRIAIAKGDKDEASKLIKLLKHDSSLFVPKTNTTYSKYWADKREECINKL